MSLEAALDFGWDGGLMSWTLLVSPGMPEPGVSSQPGPKSHAGSLLLLSTFWRRASLSPRGGHEGQGCWQWRTMTGSEAGARLMKE